MFQNGRSSKGELKGSEGLFVDRRLFERSIFLGQSYKGFDGPREVFNKTAVEVSES